MSAPALLAVGLALLLLGSWLLTRHVHRWTAWGDPEVRTSGLITQTRRCKDSKCNRHQVSRVVVS